jgi:effector-binding domain-containing protein
VNYLYEDSIIERQSADRKLGTSGAPCRARISKGRKNHEATAPPGSADRRCKENLMLLRFALCTAVAAMAIAMTLALAELQPASAQTPPPAAATNPAVKPAEPALAAPQGPTAVPTEPFGEDITLTAKTIVYVKGKGTWDDAFATITNSFKKLKTYVDKEGLKTDGLEMTIFTATDDTGFEYEAAVPIAEPPRNPPHGEIAVGQLPEGHALKFIHHGSYDELDNTYEAITNYLDEKRLEAKDMFIEEYVTDPVSSDQNKLTVNILVLLK